MKLEPGQADPNPSRIRMPFIPVAASCGVLRLKIKILGANLGFYNKLMDTKSVACGAIDVYCQNESYVFDFHDDFQ
jgi:hypothetical protein